MCQPEQPQHVSGQSDIEPADKLDDKPGNVSAFFGSYGLGDFVFCIAFFYRFFDLVV